MVLGLGTGSTVGHLLEVLAGRVREGLRIQGVPSSLRTEAEARRLGIPLTTLDEAASVDLCLDGADEVDPRLDCLKGLGGAFVREKVVASASRRFVLIVDDSKMVTRLGERSPVLVEAIPFAASFVARRLEDLDPRPRMKNGRPFISDNGNAVLELHTGPLRDPAALLRRLEATPGLAGNGLFLSMAHAAYVGSHDGVRKIEP
jgi:ribose 5-phosphate isomerase A